MPRGRKHSRYLQVAVALRSLLQGQSSQERSKVVAASNEILLNISLLLQRRQAVLEGTSLLHNTGKACKSLAPWKFVIAAVVSLLPWTEM